MKFRLKVSFAIYISTVTLYSFAESSGGWLAEQCSNCHVLESPHIEILPVSERANRIAPPLFYAGNKFQRDWLVSWLQKPERIRPAGYFPPAHVIPGPKGDVVDSASLPEHPKLSKDDAIKATDYLMSLAPYSSKIDEVEYEPGTISWKMGNLNFGKFNGCDACHRDAPDYGGLSGPELYTVWQRLQPEFIFSFISNPVSWDPHTLMPHKALNPAVVKKLADYLKVNGEEE